jgi:kinesin family protein 5
MSADVTIEYTVKVSYMEIYMEKIKDLLARKYQSTTFYKCLAHLVFSA